MKYINYYGVSDVGQIRTNNEDTFITSPLWDEEHFLFVVIDGMGGYEGGEIAAQLAQQTLQSYLEKYRNGECGQLLSEAVTAANNTIFEERIIQSRYSQMGCVITACIVDIVSQQLFISHVGDTRIYKIKGTELHKLSHDHSIVGYQEDSGEISEQEAMNHHLRNLVDRDLGSSKRKWDDKNWIESSIFSFLPGESLLLCSDGLTDMLNSHEIMDICNSGNDTQEKVEKLVFKANEKGGKDNITVVMADFISPIVQKAKTSIPSPTETIYLKNEHQCEIDKLQHSKKLAVIILSISLFIITALSILFAFKYYLLLENFKESQDIIQISKQEIKPLDSLNNTIFSKYDTISSQTIVNDILISIEPILTEQLDSIIITMQRENKILKQDKGTIE